MCSGIVVVLYETVKPTKGEAYPWPEAPCLGQSCGGHHQEADLLVLWKQWIFYLRFGFRAGRYIRDTVSAIAEDIKRGLWERRCSFFDFLWSFLWLSVPSCIAKKTGFLRVAWSFVNFPMKELVMADQIMKIKGEESQRWPIPHGVLINDLDQEKDTILFADDTTLAVSGSDPDRARESANLCLQEYRR